MIRRAVLLAIVLVFLASTIQASRPAVVVNDIIGCGMLASDGSFIDAEGKAVVTISGNSMITCKTTQPANIPRPAKAVHFNYANTGLVCATPSGETEDWTETVAPGGQATLTCKLT